MPLYRVQLKQGRRTITNHIEAKSVNDVKLFFETLSTMIVSEILEVKYQSEAKSPIDDFNYCPLYKGILKNNQRSSKQIVLNNIKKTKNENDIYQACLLHLEVGGQKVESIVSSLFKTAI